VATVVQMFWNFAFLIVTSKKIAKILKRIGKTFETTKSEQKDKKQTPYNLDVLCEI